MKLLYNVLFGLLSILFLIYIALPNLIFPPPPSDARQSVEPADSETPSRRAYFTNYTREEVLVHYQSQYQLSLFSLFDIPNYKLVYPPEEAYTLIRDQTRSTHLEEIVYPFRESFFVNEFVAKQEKDDIWYKGVHYEQKITTKINPSNLYVRFTMGLFTVVFTWLTFNSFYYSTKEFIALLPRILHIFKK